MLKKIIFLFWIPWKKAKEKRRENATKKKKKKNLPTNLWINFAIISQAPSLHTNSFIQVSKNTKGI